MSFDLQNASARMNKPLSKKKNMNTNFLEKLLLIQEEGSAEDIIFHYIALNKYQGWN